jgi:2-dehydropantoate 2-reductase
MERERGEGEPMRIALAGVGSMGTILGALLTKGGEDIVLVDVNEEHVQALNTSGARITGHMDLTVPVKAITPDDMEGIYELVIYLVKTTSDAKALPEVLPFMSGESMLITLQNGVPEEKVAAAIGRKRTLGGAIGWGATWAAPGVSELTSESEAMTYDIGELDGADTPRLHSIQAVLNKAGVANITTNLIGIRWTKLLANVSMSGLGAALGCTYGLILDDPKALLVATAIFVETIKTARALGVKMEPMQGLDPGLLLDLIKQSEENALNAIRMVYSKHRDLVASMLQDLRKGVPCEVETLNGYLSRKSAEAGVPTPINDQVTEIIRGIESGEYSLSFENLDMIEVGSLKDML